LSSSKTFSGAFHSRAAYRVAGDSGLPDCSAVTVSRSTYHCAGLANRYQNQSNFAARKILAIPCQAWFPSSVPGTEAQLENNGSLKPPRSQQQTNDFPGISRAKPGEVQIGPQPLASKRICLILWGLGRWPEPVFEIGRFNNPCMSRYEIRADFCRDAGAVDRERSTSTQSCEPW